MSDSNNKESIVDVARRIATKAHEGQKRWNGDPYITHPERVAATNEMVVFKAIALLHDVIEDTDVTYNYIRNEFLCFDTGIGEGIIFVLKYLTHRSYESYSEYITRLSDNDAACRVKLADLEDNLSDLKPGKRRDKYELAHMYLSLKLGR